MGGWGGRATLNSFVIPAKAGIQGGLSARCGVGPWTPAYAGVTGKGAGVTPLFVIPAKAGIQGE